MGMNANDAAPQQPAARYGPLTKSINVEQTLMLIGLTREFESVKAWQDEALFRLPQASRQRRQEIVRAALHNFLEVESDHFTETPLRTLLTSPLLSSRLKRDLLFAQYLRMTPLVWEAVQQVVLPRAEQAARSGGGGEAHPRLRGGDGDLREVRGEGRDRSHHHLQLRPLSHGRPRLARRADALRRRECDRR